MNNDDPIEIICIVVATAIFLIVCAYGIGVLPR